MKNARCLSDSPGLGRNLFHLVVSGLLLLSGLPLTGQQWEPVGPNDFDNLSYASVDDVHAAKGPGRSLYVVFQDLASGEKAVARKYADTAWIKLGAEPISTGIAFYTDIAVNSLGVPYVVYQDVASGYKATVKKFTGSGWTAVGEEGISVAVAYETRITIGPDDTPYIIYRDGSEASRVTVKKFTGGAWVTVGNPGFSGGVTRLPSIAIGSDGTPFAAFTDFSLGSKATVRKFDGTSWVAAGNPGISAGVAEYLEMALSSDNTPYVLYRDVSTGYKATVKRLSGTQWVTVGQAGFSAANIGATSLEITPGDAIYAAYNDLNANGRATVKRFTGAQWETVGQQGFALLGSTDGTISLVAMNDGTLSFAYSDFRARVAVFEGGEWKTLSPVGVIKQPLEFVLSVGSSHTPYLVCTGAGIATAPVLVMQFVSSSWELLPEIPPIAGDPGTYSLAEASDASVYLAFGEFMPDTVIIRVLRFKDNTWTALENTGLDIHRFSVQKFALDNNNIPYLAFSDPIASAGMQLVVYRFNGMAWEPVGDALAASTYGYSNIILDFSADNTPFLSYQEGGLISVKKFNGAAWEFVGPEYCAAAPTLINYGFAVSADGTPYIFHKSNIDRRFRLLKYDGNLWVQLGETLWNDTLTVSSAERMGLAVAGNTPYVLYQAYPYNKGIVNKWDGQAWVTLGNAPFSANEANYPTLTATPDRNIYVAYGNSEIFVKSYDDACSAFTVIINGPDTVLTDEAVLFGATNGFVQYIWDPGSGELISGQGTPAAQFRFSTPGSAVIQVTVTDQEGCTGTAAWTVVVQQAVSLHDPNLRAVNVAPNPFDACLQIETTTGLPVQVVDVAGRIRWMQGETGPGNYHLATANWPPGIYFLRLETGKGTIVRRLVKMR